MTSCEGSEIFRLTPDTSGAGPEKSPTSHVIAVSGKSRITADQLGCTRIKKQVVNEGEPGLRRAGGMPQRLKPIRSWSFTAALKGLLHP